MEKQPDRSPAYRRPQTLLLIGAVGLLLAGTIAWAVGRRDAEAPPPPQSLAHQNITTTVFWVGEEADQSNAYIHNNASTWTEDWVAAYGGVDDPNKHCDLLPCDFTPQENPFYFALPYNDLTDDCNAKPSQAEVPWYDGPPAEGHSIVKNRWARISYMGKVAYAQWEDAGPFGEDDSAYVFGGEPPKAQAGLDISPATAGYLGLDGQDQAAWEFIDEKNVPQGPWRQTVTTSPASCAN